VAEIPARLMQNGRAEDADFQPTEKMFRRYTKDNYEKGVLLSVSLSSAPSVNREKYSQASDALLSETDKYTGWGVLSFTVQDIPAQLLETNPTHMFFPKHAPDERNYAHSEVWCNKIGSSGQHVEPGNLVKKMFRALLGQRVQVEIEANI
jgi:hypothetical protein